MIFNDKLLKNQLNYALGLLVTIARIQKIHPDIIRQELLNIGANADYLRKVTTYEKPKDSIK